MDRITNILSIAIKNIFPYSPQRTTLGVILGYVLHGTAAVLSPSLASNYSQIDLSKLQELHYMFFGVFILHIRTYYNHLFYNATELDENTNKALLMIEDGVKKGYLTKKQAKEMYLEVIRKVIENREFKPRVGQQIPE